MPVEARCTKHNTLLVSHHRHDYVSCGVDDCKSFVDGGGGAYVRVGGSVSSIYTYDWETSDGRKLKAIDMEPEHLKAIYDEGFYPVPDNLVLAARLKGVHTPRWIIQVHQEPT